MNKLNNKLRDFYILWSTQSLSQLGSAMTAFALTLWLFDKTGSALSTAGLRICTYTPYILMSIFAGALTDKFDKKRTMLVCDLLAALTTIMVLVLYKTDTLSVWHLYLINAVSGLMNTVQQPASEVAFTMVIPKEYYQKTGALRSLSQSMNTILTPVLATMLFAFGGISAVMTVDLITFSSAFMVLLLFILGVSSIREFALPLMIGLISGTYSSIFIAAALWYVMKLHLGKDKLMKPAAKTKKK